MKFVKDDGGRAAAGYKGKAGDCGVRAAAIATGLTYQECYDRINLLALDERPRGAKKRSDARTGIWPETLGKLLVAEGFTWTPTMGIGTGCKVHLTDGEVPTGRVVARVSRHFVAIIDGVIHDTDNPARHGGRCVYGYWRKA